MTAAPASSGLPALEKYELLEEIGHGGMATVYRAKDPRLGREVAVKVIHKHLRENKEVATRFVAEARAAAKLRHPGIVEVYDVSSEDDGERYLVVELLRGTTLRKVLQDHREMPAEIGAAIVLELCAALEHAHAGAVIHRDIKPENVLVELPADRAGIPAPKASSSGARPAFDAPPSAPASDPKAASSKKPRPADPGVVIKVTDFGIAKILDAQGVTSTGQVLGSPAHMAPEQIEGGEVDARTDVFALGVLMYECMVGHLPFEGKNPAQVLRRVLDGTYPAADRERATVGGRWAKILARALSREAEGRTKCPAALGVDIQGELAALGIDDPHAEIGAYFADPEGYARALQDRLVPRLVARGEAAKKARDVTGAADDFNRALAFCPSDLAILKRITSLNSTASRRLLARRLGGIVAGSAVLGLVAFGVVRWIRATPALQPPEPSPPPTFDLIVPSPEGSAPRAEGSGETARGDVTAAMSARPRLRLAPGAFGSAVAAAGTGSAAAGSGAVRIVRFVPNPKSAKLTLDGTPQGEVFGKKFKLAPGLHTWEITLNDAKCCKPRTGATMVTSPPDGNPDKELTVQVNMDILPATVTVRGPQGATFRCPALVLSGAVPFSGTVTMKDPVTRSSCSLTSLEGAVKQASFDFKAGEPNLVTWPD